ARLGRRAGSGGAAKRSLRVALREGFRVLRSNLLVAILDLANPVVVVTSAFAREGKTATAATLAESIAATGPRVVLADMDLRNPACHRVLGPPNESGVPDVLLDRRPLQESLQSA